MVIITNKRKDEAELWVPRKAAHAGLQFLAQKIPHAPPKLITEFLRKINKVSAEKCGFVYQNIGS